MILTEEHRKEMEAAAKPLWEFMAKCCHPHTRIILEHDSVELVEGVARGVNRKFAEPDRGTVAMAVQSIVGLLGYGSRRRVELERNSGTSKGTAYRAMKKLELDGRIVKGIDNKWSLVKETDHQSL